MSHFRQTVLTIALATAAIGTCAQTDAQHKQHQARVLATEQSSAAPDTSTATPGSAGKMAAMDTRMKMMREAHNQLLGAKTPEERSALMATHMKAMQDGMQTLNMMGPDGMGSMKGEKHFGRNSKERLEMMQKRMEMMESMMQMMMDRMPTPAAN